MVRGTDTSIAPNLTARSLPAHEALRSAGFAGGKHVPVASLIMCAPSVGWVDMSVINGEIVVKDGKLKTLDMQVLSMLQAHLIMHIPGSVIEGKLNVVNRNLHIWEV